MAWRTLSLSLAALGATALSACGQGASTTSPGAATPVSLPVSAGGTSTFTDPTQNAFTISTPAGWATNGGMESGVPWVTAASPDGATTIIVGDRSIPTFATPSAMHPQGSSWQGAGGAVSSAEPFEGAAQFARDYASHAFGQVCGQLQPTGAAAEPEFAEAAQANAAHMSALVGGPQPRAQFDGASATFTCQGDGGAEAVGVIDVTAYSQAPGGAGFWYVPVLVAYRTPAASQAQTDQLARAMRASLQPNPQWQAQTAAATRQLLAAQQEQGAAFSQAMAQQQQQQTAASLAQGQASEDALNAQHQAYMNQQAAQGAQQTQNFNQQQYDRQTQQENQLRYINGQTCLQWADDAHTRCAVEGAN